jgi:L-lysine exporter family protein LysE/ArgO
MTTALLTGLVTGFGLIVAIGAQNAFVLRQGLARHHVGVVVAICAISDLLLIVAGTAGMGKVISAVPALLTALTWVGAAYLVWFGIQSLRSARNPSGLSTSGSRAKGSIIATALALTWLNPHVYLDTLVFLGSVATSHADRRWWFAGGAASASLLWFTGLGYGARLLAPVFARPLAWRILDALIAVVMITLGLTLLR